MKERSCPCLSPFRFISYIGATIVNEKAREAFDSLAEVRRAILPRLAGCICTPSTAERPIIFASANFGGQHLWAVAPYIERGIDVPEHSIRAQDLTAFIAANVDLLDNPGHSIGTWYNPEDDRTYLDIVVTLAEENAAIEVAEQFIT